MKEPATVAVVVAHPDDEVLGFGGTICRHGAAGDAVHVLFLATGLASRNDDGRVSPDELHRLHRQAESAGKVLGVTGMEFGDFPDNRMDRVALLDVVKRVERFLDHTKAGIVYTHHAGDLNVDHGITARAVLTACRPQPGSRVQMLYGGEVLSSSEYAFPYDRFIPTCYLGIDRYLERKCAALQCYTEEIRAWPHPRSVEGIQALARLRGSESGMEAAEALVLIREVRP
jgi:LmbE family N-acetylglucosaminyl deacetylase